MGLCNSPDIFQEKMNKLFAGFDHVQAYLENLLVITKRSYWDHLDHLDVVLDKLEHVGLKINAQKSNFAAHELEYLCYWIIRACIQPMRSKVEAIKKMVTPKKLESVA